MENFSLSKILSNKNTILVSVLLALIGVGLSFAVGRLCDNAILEADKNWDRALKFTVENAEEFPYCVKTKQGNLYATGPVVAASSLVTHENIDGEYMSIRESHEEYRRHTETYPCNCTDDGCSVCTRTYWSWDYAGSETWRVETVSLLGQEMPSNTIGWEMGYSAVNTKEGHRLLYTDSHHRQYYDVIAGPVEGSWGFTSDDDGFRYNSELDGPRSGAMKVAKIALIIFLLIGTGIGIWCFIVSTYEQNDQYI